MPLRSRGNFIHLKNLLSADFFGDLYLIEADYMYGRLNKLTDGWRGRDPGYSVTLGGGIHMIDLIMWITGSRVTEVSAFGTTIATAKKLEFGNPDTEIVNLKLENGALARITSNFPVVSRHHHRVALFGTERSYLLDSLGETYTERVEGEPRTLQMRSREESEFPDDCLANYLDSIVSGTKALVSCEEAMSSAQVALQIKRSVAAGTVELISPFSS
jgi:predicted dehydrogenase